MYVLASAAHGSQGMRPSAGSTIAGVCTEASPRFVLTSWSHTLGARDAAVRLQCRQWVSEAEALVLENLEILLETAIQRHADLPRPGEHLWILDDGFVLQMVRAERRVPFDDVQLLAMEVPRFVKPRLVVE